MKKIPERRGKRMKENRKLLKEVLKDIEHDMTDEEVLNLLADSKISESPTAEKYTLGQRAADATQAGGREAHEQSPIRGEQHGFHGLLTHWIIVECRKDM